MKLIQNEVTILILKEKKRYSPLKSRAKAEKGKTGNNSLYRNSMQWSILTRLLDTMTVLIFKDRLHKRKIKPLFKWIADVVVVIIVAG